MSLYTLQQIKKYFANDIGPVFCMPTTHLLWRYKALKGMVGILMPKTSDTAFLDVDWSLNAGYNLALATQPDLSTLKYTQDELNICVLGADIPQLADDSYTSWDWTPNGRGQVVCISDARWRDLAERLPAVANSYTELRRLPGIVVEKCKGNMESMMVSFAIKDNQVSIVNVPLEILLKLPASFRKLRKTEKRTSRVFPQDPHIRDTNGFHGHGSYEPTQKHDVGDVVRVSTEHDHGSVALGLLGVVKEVNKVKPKAAHASYSLEYEYVVNFDTLPNRCLSLCEGEEEGGLLKTRAFRSYGLEEWTERVSDKPHFYTYNKSRKRDQVWVLKQAEKGEIEKRGSPHKSKENGVEIHVELSEIDGSPSYVLSCRDVDYLWDIERLKEALAGSVKMLGIEEEKFSPNDPAITKLYIYAYENKEAVGKQIKYRVLLGTLTSKKAQITKFYKGYKNRKLMHPWSVRRYLETDTLGYFFHLFEASTFLVDVGYFYQPSEE